MLKELHCLIIDPDPHSRARLREALRSITLKSVCDMAKSYQASYIKLELNQKYDCVFAASTEKRALLKDLRTRMLKAAGDSKAPLLIIVLKQQHTTSTFVADLYAGGIDGFVCEPFSPEKLLELLNVARDESEKKIEKPQLDVRATDFLMNDAMRLIDRLAALRDKGETQGGYTLRELREVSGALREMVPSLEQQTFEDLLIEKFSKATTEKKQATPLTSAHRSLVREHPGSVVKRLMQERSLQFDRALEALKIEEQTFQDILDCRADLTEELARHFSRVFGQGQRYWMKLQEDYNEYLATKR